ncbi:MAG: DUF4328 domain-containing protein [Acidimicrobiales bacterium]
MSDSPGYPGAPPGWYPDPAGGPGRRWWDGYTWTEAVVLPAQAPPPPPPPPPPLAPGAPPAGPPAFGASVGGPPAYVTTGGGPPAYGATGYGATWPAEPAGRASTLLGDELRFTRLGRISVVVIAVYYLWNIVNLRVNTSRYRSIGRQIQRAYRAAEHNRAAPPITVPNNSNGALVTVGALLGLATIAAVVCACIWQYRAASTARALGLPAKHSPGWGVGSWFVPVVNLWMPYQAIRDCLAKEDARRALVAWYWVSLIGAEALTTAATVASLFSSGVSLALCIPAALLCVGMLATAPRFVAAIAAAHRDALAA